MIVAKLKAIFFMTSPCRLRINAGDLLRRPSRLPATTARLQMSFKWLIRLKSLIAPSKSGQVKAEAMKNFPLSPIHSQLLFQPALSLFQIVKLEKLAVGSEPDVPILCAST
jgi:hypothetical protein